MTVTQPPTKEARRTSGRVDSILLTVVAAIVSIMLCVNPAPNNDLFWQLRTGAMFVREHRPPHFDVFSWTLHGSPWVAHEWLSFAMFHAVYSVAGYVGIWLWMTTLVTVAFTGLFRLTVRQARRAWPNASTGERSPVFVAFFLWLAAVAAAGLFFQPRPQVCTYTLLTLTVWLILDARTSNTPASIRRLWLLPAIFVLWANLHAGVLVGFGVTAAIAIGDAIEARLTKSDDGREFRRRMAQVTALGAIATFITPYSYHEYQNFFATLLNTTEMNTVGEWVALDLHTPLGHIVEFYLALVFACLAFSKRRRSVTDLAIFALLAYEALGANRNIPLLAIVGTPLIAPYATSFAGDVKLAGSRAFAWFAAACAVVVTSTIAVNALADSPVRSTSLARKVALTTIEYPSYPKAACDFLNSEPFPRGMRLYNMFSEGGYIIMHAPEHPVFVDSRADLYFGKILDEISEMRSLPYNWDDRLGRQGVDLILWDKSERQASLFLGSPNWALVYAEPESAYHGRQPVAESLIFVRRLPEYAALIDRCRRDCPAFDAARSEFKEYPAVD